MNSDAQNTAQFIHLLTGHQSLMRAFIVSKMPGSPDVQDVLQDVNLILWQKMSAFEVGSNFKAWAFAIIRNVIREYRRKNQNSQVQALNEEVIDAINESWGRRSTENVTSKEIALDQCMAALNDGERSLIDARYKKGSTLEAYAKKIGKTAESLRVTLYRVREKLRDCVRKRVILIDMEREAE